MAALVTGACRTHQPSNSRTLAARLDEGPSGRSIVVPGEQPSVAAAVAAAGPGDLILLSPGLYRERVEIDTARLVVRGIDRNTVVFDGGNQLAEGIVLRADGAVVENLTVRNYRGDGIVVDGAAAAQPGDAAQPGGAARPVDGFRVSHVTVYGNGGNGIVARAARGGLIEASHASGHPAAGIAVEGCRPCDTVVSASVGESNAVGFRALDPGGGLVVVGSSWLANRVGVVVRPESSAAEDGPALRPAVVVAGNLVTANANAEAPVSEVGLFGSGVVLAGPVAADVVRNRVAGHPGAGVVVTDFERRAPRGIEVRENVLAANGTDLAFYLVGVAFDDTGGNCFAANDHASAVPADIEVRLGCNGHRGKRTERDVRFAAPRLPAAPAAPAAPVAPPPPQAQLPTRAAPAQPASSDPPPVDLGAVVVPAAAN